MVVNRFTINGYDMKATMNDIARRAGVSKAAVSSAFNNREKVSEQTYKRIMAIAEEIGYVPDPVARTLAMRKTGTVGFLLPQPVQEAFLNPYVLELMRGIGTVCDREGLSLSVLSPLKGILSQTVKNAAVDGMITLGISSESEGEIHRLLRRRRIPYVTIDAGTAGDYINVGIDDVLMACRLMGHLLDLGHRYIAVCTLKDIFPDLAEPCQSPVIAARLEGVSRALSERKLPARTVRIYESESSVSSAYELARDILSQADRPGAVFCMADVHAYGFYQAARELSVRIPRDLSVAGFDDVPFSALLEPPLTTVSQSGYEKGFAAAELLVKSIAGESCVSVSLDATVIVRRSTDVCPDGRT